MNDEIIPFGKYKGRLLGEVIEDKQYLDWLLAQSWFPEKYSGMYNIIINNFQEPTETPQHNAMQIKFLNDDYVIGFLKRFLKYHDDIVIEKRIFEARGWDVYVRICGCCRKTKLAAIEIQNRIQTLKSDLALLEHPKLSSYGDESWRQYESKKQSIEKKIRKADEELSGMRYLEREDIYIEIKPTVSDDFPAVFRQISKLKGRNFCEIALLLVGEYTGIGATKEEFVEFMKSGGITVIFDGQAD